jgi:hypothetical protein
MQGKLMQAVQRMHPQLQVREAGSHNEPQVYLWLVVALASSVAVALIMTISLMVAGEDFNKAFSATSLQYNLHNGILGDNAGVGNDSWDPMLLAYHRRFEGSEHNLYDVFLKEHEKFQYPPPSLLPFDLLPQWLATLEGSKINDVLAWRLRRLSWVAYALTIVVSLVIFELRLAQLKITAIPIRLSSIAIRVSLALAVGLLFYPSLKAYTLGQVQVFMNCLVAVTILSFILGYKTFSGLCIGVCTLLKPQYGLLAIWALLSREWSFAAGLISIAVLGYSVSLARFGIADHMQYLEVLSFLSKTGEAFWPNQSMNGLLNRLLGNGDPVRFSHFSFPPFNMTVYVGTLISSLSFIVLALLPRHRDSHANKRHLDLMTSLVAVTIASPIAWEHHYGILLPIIGASLPELILMRPFGRGTGALVACSYIACSSVLFRPEMIFENKWIGIIGSHLFFGGVLWFVMLQVLRNHQDSNRQDS